MPRPSRTACPSLAWLVPLALVAGCKSSRYEVEVHFMEGIDPSEVRFIELLVLPDCPSATEVLSGEAPEGVIVGGVGLSQAATTLPAIGSLPPGTYGLYARGFNTTCTAVVAGCVTVALEDDATEVLYVELEPTAEVPACAPEAICVDGECIVDPSDACGSHPCAPSEYCTDLPEPAPVDATGRMCTPLTECGTGEYQATAPTLREDRVCAPCQSCDAAQIELVACADGNEPQDRVCGLGDQVCTLVAFQDGEANASLIFGATGDGETMRVVSDGLAPMYGFVQFDVAGGTCEEGGSIPANATVQSASLKLVRDGGCGVCGAGHGLGRVTEGWDESSVTAGLGPDVAGTMSATFDAPEAGSAVVVTGPYLASDVQEMLETPASNDGWRIQHTEPPGNGLSPFAWATRESPTASSRPRLIVTYQTP